MTTIGGDIAAALAGRYTIERELGAGGMATVFLGHDLRHDRDVAIKVLHPDLGAALGAANVGAEPVWSRDGKRLFYRGDGHFMAARLATGPGFAIAARDTLFADVFQFAPNPHANYDVMADGAHFVFLKAATEGT